MLDPLAHGLVDALRSPLRLCLVLLTCGSGKILLIHGLKDAGLTLNLSQFKSLVEETPSRLWGGLTLAEVEDKLRALSYYIDPPHERGVPYYQPARLAVGLDEASPADVALAPFASHPALPPAALARLAFSPERETRRAVAQNPNTSRELLRWLRREFPDEVAQNPAQALFLLEDPSADR